MSNPRDGNCRVVSFGERIGGQRVPVRAPLGRHRHETTQPERRRQRGLKAVASVLINQVAVVGIVETEVDLLSPRLTCYQQVTQLMKDQLRQAIVRVEILAARQSEHTLAIPRRIDVTGTDEPNPEFRERCLPHALDGIAVLKLDATRHGTLPIVRGATICKSEPSARFQTRDIPYTRRSPGGTGAPKVQKAGCFRLGVLADFG
jgi:hypothetical protein